MESESLVSFAKSKFGIGSGLLIGFCVLALNEAINDKSAADRQLLIKATDLTRLIDALRATDGGITIKMDRSQIDSLAAWIQQNPSQARIMDELLRKFAKRQEQVIRD